MTPAGNNLFDKGNGKLLESAKKEIFHQVIAKGLFISNLHQPYIIPTVSILSGRVQEPKQNNSEKEVSEIQGVQKLTFGVGT